MPRPIPENITETGSIFFLVQDFFGLIDYLPLISRVVPPGGLWAAITGVKPD